MYIVKMDKCKSEAVGVVLQEHIQTTKARKQHTQAQLEKPREKQQPKEKQQRRKKEQLTVKQKHLESELNVKAPRAFDWQTSRNSEVTDSLNSKAKERRERAVSLGHQKLASLRYVNKKPFVNIRQYRSDQHGRMFSTKKGIMLTLEEWRRLKNETSVLDI